jgi:hypothetical protein
MFYQLYVFKCFPLLYLQNKDDFEGFKEKGHKARHLLMKVFARSTSTTTHEQKDPQASDPKIGMTKNTKTFKKIVEKEEESKSEETITKLEEHLPVRGNGTILDSK